MEGIAFRQFRNVCVFCGSSPGKDEEYVKAAQNLGMVLVRRKIHLIYGGGNHGLMGCVSTAVHVGGCQVLGIIPTALAASNIVGKTIREEFRVVSMHERMARMISNADAFIALPGGFGTLEVIFQIVSWAQLNMHHKPLGLLNVNHFFDGLLSFLDHAVEQMFISHLARRILISASNAEKLIYAALQAYVHALDPITAQIEWTTDHSKMRKLDLDLHL